MVGAITGGWRLMSGMNFQTLSSFHNPLQAYTYNPGKGLYLLARSGSISRSARHVSDHVRIYERPRHSDDFGL